MTIWSVFPNPVTFILVISTWYILEAIVSQRQLFGSWLVWHHVCWSTQMLYTKHCRRIITYHKYHIILTYLINHAIVIVVHTWSMEKESTPLWPRSCYQCLSEGSTMNYCVVRYILCSSPRP